MAAAPAAEPLEEIVVTAQRREQNLQDVSISIAAFSGKDLQALHADQPLQISTLTPGLFAAGSRGDANPIFTMRGIGLNDVFSNNNPTVGVYVDEVVQPFTPMLGFQMFDLDRVEVLKGPQGTLYGRNTTGGAINFISRKPSAEESGYATVGWSRFDRADVEAAIGGPISESWQGRIAAKTTQQSGGWQTNEVTGRTIGKVDRTSVRGQLRWLASDAVEVLLKGDYFRDDSDQQLREHVGFLAAPFSFTPCQGFLNGVRDEAGCVDFLGYSDTNPDRRTVANSALYGYKAKTDAWDGALTVNWKLPGATLTSITGYSKYKRTAGDDSDGSPLIQLDSLFTDDIKSFTQELRLASGDKSSPLTWVVGGFYSSDQIDGDILQALDQHIFQTRVDTDWTQKTDSFALFGQAEYMLTEHWRLIAGLRYTNEEKKFRYDSIDLNPFGTSQNLPTPVAGIHSKLKENNTSGRLGLDYVVSKDLLLYASASKGFKSGGYKAAIAFNPAELDPFTGENLYAYEIGAKSTLLDGKLQLNGALYYYDWRDFQAYVTEIRGGINVVVLSNAGNAEVKGGEIELVAHPVQDLTLRAAANYMDSKITKFNAAPGASDFAGNHLANAPDFTFSGLARYEFPLGGSPYKLFVSGDGSYRTRTYYSVSNYKQYSQEAFWLLNAELGVRQAEDRWQASIWGRNLADKLYVSQSYDNFGGIFPSQDFLGDPRTYGVSFTVRF